MGCCNSNFDKAKEALVTLEDFDLSHVQLPQTDEGFGDISLDSHEGKFPTYESSRKTLEDSILNYTRPTSISLHRSDIEIAFLQTSGLIRRNTLDFSKQSTHCPILN